MFLPGLQLLCMVAMPFAGTAILRSHTDDKLIEKMLPQIPISHEGCMDTVAAAPHGSILGRAQITLE